MKANRRGFTLFSICCPIEQMLFQLVLLAAELKCAIGAGCHYSLCRNGRGGRLREW